MGLCKMISEEFLDMFWIIIIPEEHKPTTVCVIAL